MSLAGTNTKTFIRQLTMQPCKLQKDLWSTKVDFSFSPHLWWLLRVKSEAKIGWSARQWVLNTHHGMKIRFWEAKEEKIYVTVRMLLIWQKRKSLRLYLNMLTETLFQVIYNILIKIFHALIGRFQISTADKTAWKASYHKSRALTFSKWIEVTTLVTK
jgi:hypothetical protein